MNKNKLSCPPLSILEPRDIIPYDNMMIVGPQDGGPQDGGPQDRGLRGAGKSWLIRYIIKHFDRFGVTNGEIIVISSLEKTIPFYANFVSGKIYFEITSELINEIFEYQKNKNTHLLLILDCCISHNMQFHKDDPLTELLSNARSHNITYIVSTIFPHNFPLYIRQKINYAFFASTDATHNQKILYSQYARIFPTFNSFRNIFLFLTQKYGFMCMHGNLVKHAVIPDEEYKLSIKSANLLGDTYVDDLDDTDSVISSSSTNTDDYPELTAESIDGTAPPRTKAQPDRKNIITLLKQIANTNKNLTDIIKKIQI